MDTYEIPPISVPLGSTSIPHEPNLSSTSSSKSKTATSMNDASCSRASSSQPTLPLLSTHPMKTRSKSGIFKPKLLIAVVHQEPSTATQALDIPHWKQAMDAEYTTLVKNHTWDLVPSSDAMRIVNCKWVFHTKLKVIGSLDKYKARLVAKGFQQTPIVDFFETFSPFVKVSTIRIVFTIAVSQGWNIQQIDINNAFLNGDLQEEVFMSQPEGFVNPTKPNHVCRLRKALYGLKQAPRAWFDKLKNVLINWGFSYTVSDTSLFYSRKHGRMIVLLVYVDDILITGESSDDIQQVIVDLHDRFSQDLRTCSLFSWF